MKINKFEIISLLTEEECSLYSFLGYLSPQDEDLGKAREALLELLSKDYIQVKMQTKVLDKNKAAEILKNSDNYKSQDILVVANKTGEDYYYNNPEVKVYF